MAPLSQDRGETTTGSELAGAFRIPIVFANIPDLRLGREHPINKSRAGDTPAATTQRLARNARLVCDHLRMTKNCRPRGLRVQRA